MTIGKYPIIYADPPWRYAQKGLQGAAEHHYPTMSINELCALPVAELAAPDSALFLWATFPQLPEALRLIEAWGFTYAALNQWWSFRGRCAALNRELRSPALLNRQVRSNRSRTFPTAPKASCENSCQNRQRQSPGPGAESFSVHTTRSFPIFPICQERYYILQIVYHIFPFMSIVPCF